jgi:hypothetical protein
MARRRAAKATEKPVSKSGGAPRGKAKAAAPDLTLKERLAAAERERDALRVELERVQTRVRVLEETQSNVRDRIGWAVESLHDILEGKD